MKRVLVIANLFHASPRVPGFSAYLHDYGWDATVVTPPLKSEDKKSLGLSEKFLGRVKIAEAPYRGDIFWFWRKIFKILGFKTGESITGQIKEKVGGAGQKSLVDKLMVFYQTFFAYPDTEKTWDAPAIKVAKKELEREKYDALISSSPFPTSHIVASKLKSKFKIPWLADFRDPWSENHAYPFGPIRRALDRWLEKKTLQNADAIVAATPGYAGKEKALLRRNVEVITNGFEPEILLRGVTPTPKFTITYTGSIYKDKQDPSKLFAAVSKLIQEKKIAAVETEIRFYGRRVPWLDSEIRKYGLENVIREYGPVSKEESLKKQAESQVLLVLGWEGEEGVYPLKIFEYLAARRPILITGGKPTEEIKGLIADIGAGKSGVTIEEVKKSIVDFYGEYKKSGKVGYCGDERKFLEYSYPAIAEKFADILDKISEK